MLKFALCANCWGVKIFNLLFKEAVLLDVWITFLGKLLTFWIGIIGDCTAILCGVLSDFCVGSAENIEHCLNYKVI